MYKRSLVTYFIILLSARDIFFLGRGLSLPEDPMFYAGLSGNIECIEFLLSQGEKLSTSLFDNVCVSGNIETLEYLFEKKCPCKCTCYIKAKNVDVVKFLLSKECKPEMFFLVEDAIETKNVDKLRVVVDAGYNLSRINLSEEVSIFPLETLKWMRKNGIGFLEYAMTESIKVSREMTDWLIEEKCSWGDFTILECIKRRKFKDVQYLISKGCQWGYGAIEEALKRYSFEKLEWMSDRISLLQSFCYPHQETRMGNEERMQTIQDSSTYTLEGKLF